MLIRILKRDSYGRTIQVECPHCLQAATLGLKEVEHLEHGKGIAIACRDCYQPIDVALRELVIDGGLQVVRLGDARYMVAFAPSTGPGGGIPTQLEGVVALDAFLQSLEVPPDPLHQLFTELETRLVAVQTVRVALHHLMRARLIA